MSEVRLLKPDLATLPAYKAALERGWSPDNLRGAIAAKEQLAKIAADPQGFVASMDDLEAKGGDVILPDGAEAPRLPGFQRWIWDGEFCGSIGFRWQPGSSSLPDYVMGHIGYAVVPWKQHRGCATAALRLMLLQARAFGLDHVEITTTEDNPASQRVILANGGVFDCAFEKSPHHGRGQALRYRIVL